MASRTDSERVRVLIIDDNEEILEINSARLGDAYDVLTASSGEEGLELLDDSIDVVLLDRRMPGLTGDDVLSTIQEEGYNCRVAMVTGVDPEYDIVDMPFDDYLVKPVSGDQLRDTVDSLARLVDYDAVLQRYFSLTTKRASLKTSKSPGELAANDQFAELESEIESTKDEVESILDDVPAEEYNQVFKALA